VVSKTQAPKPKIKSLVRKSDFFRLSKNGKRQNLEPWLVLYSMKNELEFHRLGFSISRQAAPSVIRNKLRRYIKDLLPKVLIDPKLKELQGLDLHFQFKPVNKSKSEEFYRKLSYALLKESVERGFKKI
jgi:ribonuclease P protein component